MRAFLLIDLQNDFMPGGALPVTDGDAVITSGFGGIYPKGIPVGQIVSQHSDDTGLLKVALIETAVDFQRLEDVAIITSSREAPPAPIQPAPLSPGAAAAAEISVTQAKAAEQ